jgi:hypothetical protein
MVFDQGETEILVAGPRKARSLKKSEQNLNMWGLQKRTATIWMAQPPEILGGDEGV